MARGRKETVLSKFLKKYKVSVNPNKETLIKELTDKLITVQEPTM